MKTIKKIVIGILLAFLIIQKASGQVEKAYQHLYNVMDKYHKSFDVYSDHDAGGNNFYPTKFGDINAISLTSDYTKDSLQGYSCLKINYSKESSVAQGWSGIYWLYPGSNWGDTIGHIINGADSLIFWAKGEKGGEEVEFKIGGVNQFPNEDKSKPFIDSLDLLSTGVVKLTDFWKKYAFDLTAKENFSVYIDKNSGSRNHYSPTMWFNGSSNLKIDDNCKIKPHSGETCIRLNYNGTRGADFTRWNGVLWVTKEGDDYNGYNLTGATKLSFWAKSEISGLYVKFFSGSKYSSCGEVSLGNVRLDTIWTKFEINLINKDLSRVAGGIGFSFADPNNMYPAGFAFYLDDIQYDKPLNKKLTNVIGGFCSIVEKTRNPEGCTFYLDNIKYLLNNAAIENRKLQPHFLVSYETTHNRAIDDYIRNASYTYDNAMAMIALMSRGTDEDWLRAKVLANTFVACWKNEPQYTDNRLRNGYQSGDVIDRKTGEAKLSGIYIDQIGDWTMDDFCAYTHTGNMAWAIIALTKYYKEKGGKEYIDCAKSLADWIVNYTKDDRGNGGYMGGFEDGGHSKVLWKSTEHNLDVYIAFINLCVLTKDKKWLQYANYAKTFIRSMWSDTGKFFWTGTNLDGISINKSNLVEDIQSWGILVFNKDKGYYTAVDWVTKNCYVASDGFKGFDFNNDKDGIWFEGTANLCLAFQTIEKQDSSDFYINELRKAQQTATNNNGLGIVAATHDNISTGINWLYHNRLHIGATAWYILAENRYNPYWNLPISECPGIPDSICNTSINSFYQQKFNLQIIPNPVSKFLTIKYQMEKPGKIEISFFNLSGQLIKVLSNEWVNQGVNTFKININSDFDDGLYLCQISSLQNYEISKFVVIKNK